MASVVREDYFVCTDVAANHNRFWHIQELDDASIRTRWGRVGISEDTKTWAFGSQSEAARQYDSKVKSKLKVTNHRDSYTRLDILTASHAVPPPSHASIGDVAAREVDVDSETTRDLIRWLSKVNVHSILTGTTMAYDAASGMFSTPLGVVGKPMIDRARVLLNDITPHVRAASYDDPALRKMANEYLRLIPQDLGGTHRKIRLDTIFTVETLRRQADILDSLEASVQSILTASAPTPTIEDRRTFNTRVTAVDDDGQIAVVRQMYEVTRQQRHSSYSYKLKQVYSIDIAGVRSAWEADGAKLENRLRLWHGTRPPNVLSILKGGLIVPSTAAHGRAFGDGCYFANVSTKSLQYSTGYHAGESAMERVFMFLADVGLGKYHTPQSSIRKWPTDCDSIWAKVGKTTSLLNDEIIVPKPSRCNLVYLVEFTR